MVRHRHWTNGHSPMIFAAKTTASGLIALLIAFTFNLDQPQWALLTVFIVSQPQSGLVLAKSFYRIIGTLIGAAVALLLVALFAQERVLFLGALALWIGGCTFGSQYARNFAAYSFVLSGYTVAIVGIPAALEAEQCLLYCQRARHRDLPRHHRRRRHQPHRLSKLACCHTLAIRGGGAPGADRLSRRDAGRRPCCEIGRAAGEQGNRDREPARIGNI